MFGKVYNSFLKSVGNNDDCPPSITLSWAINCVWSNVTELFLYKTEGLLRYSTKSSEFTIEFTEVRKFWVGPLYPIFMEGVFDVSNNDW